MNRAESKWIDDWNPEDTTFWDKVGKRIARRNLIWSIVAENIGFSIWLIWSVVATRLPKIGFHYTTDQLFNLVALPGLVGSLMRFPYCLRRPEVRRPQLDGGERKPSADPDDLPRCPRDRTRERRTGRWRSPRAPRVWAAATSPPAWPTFRSSIRTGRRASRSDSNAAGGNIGVSTVQLLVPLIIGCSWVNLGAIEPSGRPVSRERGPHVASADRAGHLRRLEVHGQPLLVALEPERPARHRAPQAHVDHGVALHRHVRLVHRVLGRVSAPLKTQFPEHAANLAFLGPLVGSLARPLGGRIADKVGGTRMTFWNFAAMGLATVAVIHFVDDHRFGGFLAMFLVLFVTTGLGNGSTFRMIPVIFRNEKLRGRRAPGSGSQGGRSQGRAHRERRGHRVRLGDWSLRWLFDPADLRSVDQSDRVGSHGVRRVRRLLPHVPRLDLGVLHASQGGACRRRERRSADSNPRPSVREGETGRGGGEEFSFCISQKLLSSSPPCHLSQERILRHHAEVGSPGVLGVLALVHRAPRWVRVEQRDGDERRSARWGRAVRRRSRRPNRRRLDDWPFARRERLGWRRLGRERRGRGRSGRRVGRGLGGSDHRRLSDVSARLSVQRGRLGRAARSGLCHLHREPRGARRRHRRRVSRRRVRQRRPALAAAGHGPDERRLRLRHERRLLPERWRGRGGADSQRRALREREHPQLGSSHDDCSSKAAVASSSFTRGTRRARRPGGRAS